MCFIIYCFVLQLQDVSGEVQGFSSNSLNACFSYIFLRIIFIIITLSGIVAHFARS